MKYPTCLSSVAKDLGGIKSLSDVFVALQLSFGSVGNAIADMVAAASSGAGVFGTLSAGAAALSGTLVPIVAVAAAVAAGIYAISKAQASASEANDKMRDSYSAYQEAQSNLENVNSELDTTKASMDELLGKEHLTFVEEAELQRLKDATEQLLIQQDLAEREENKAARKAAEDTVSAYKKNFKNEISADETKERQDYAQMSGNNAGLTADSKDISAMLAAIKQFDALKQEAKNELAEAQKAGNDSDIEWLEEDIKHYDDLNQDLTDSIWDQVKLLTEYRDKLKALPEDELAKVDGASDVLNQIDDQIAYIYSELDPAAWKQMQFDEILNSDEYKKAKDELTELAKATDGAGISVDDVKEKYPELASAIEGAGLSLSDFVDLINSSADATDDASEAVVSNAERIQNAIDDTTKKSQELTSQIDAVQSVLNSQMTGKSISVEDFNSDELADYRSALEYVNGTMQLNADKVTEIAKAKADEQVAINNTNKALAQSQYLENARQIEQYRQQLRDASFAEGETADSIQSSIDALLDENSAIADTCAQYDLLSASIQEAVGAYQHWLNAQSASDYGDMANDKDLHDYQKGSKSASLAYEPKSNEMVLTAHRFFANKSCPGDWLYSRYSDLANRINALLGSGTTASGGNSNDSTNTSAPSKPNTNFPKVPFTVNVIVSDLNIRKAPNGDIVGKTEKGVFTITSVKNGWGKLKSGAGWIYLANADYCTIGSSVSGTSSKPSTNVSKVPYKVRVDASDLRIRSGAGTNYPTTGEYTGKGTFTIIEEKAGTGSTKGWGKLKSGAGWISLDYCVKL